MLDPTAIPPLPDHSIAPAESIAEEEECPPASKVSTEQAAAMPEEGSCTEKRSTIGTMDKGAVDNGGLKTVVDIRADASAAASHYFERR